MPTEASIPKHRAVAVLPRIRVQNANSISSPMTWGFPAITAFTGLMTALERRLGRDAGIALYGIGVICHSFEAQVTSSGYTRAFHLTRNPVLPDGSTPGIVEEGRVHLELTLVFDVELADEQRGDAERAALAERMAFELAGMRLAGGSVMPPLPGRVPRVSRPLLQLVPDAVQSAEDIKVYRDWFRRLTRRWLPGFALVSRDELLQARLTELRVQDPAATALDAWLDLSRWNIRAVPPLPDEGSEAPSKVEWVHDPRPGWTVPIPVGFTSLSRLHDPGTVSGARDMNTPLCFVETLWSMGQWISPHRLKSISDLVWRPVHVSDPQLAGENGLYRCVNDYQVPVAQMEETAELTADINH